MKLAEALMQRQDIVKEINKIKEELLSAAVIRSDLELKINIADKIEKLKELEEKLFNLNVDIDKANKENLLNEINRLRILDSSISFWKELREKVLHAGSDFGWGSRDEIKYKINLNIDEVNSELDKLEKARREIDRQLQKKNWQIEI